MHFDAVDALIEEEAKEACRKTYWRTKQGEVIRISEMTDSHLKNAYLLLERNKKSTYYLYPEILKRATRAMVETWLSSVSEERSDESTSEVL